MALDRRVALARFLAMTPRSSLRRRAEGAAVAFRASTKPKTAKAKRIFRQTKRAVSYPGPQAIEIIGREIRGFRGIVCFQALNRLFASRFRRMGSPGPKSGDTKRITYVSEYSKHS
jgi:hypothetical protein